MESACLVGPAAEQASSPRRSYSSHIPADRKICYDDDNAIDVLRAGEINVMGNPSPDPTPEEIRAACLEYQQEWDEREHRRRAGLVTPDERLALWTVPVVAVGS